MFSPVLHVGSGYWMIGRIEEHTAKPLPESEVRAACERLNRAAAPEISDAQIREWFYQNWAWEQNENLVRAVIKTVRSALDKEGGERAAV